MGLYKNPKTRAKAYKKYMDEKKKYAHEHKEKELAKQKEKRENYNKYNKKKNNKKVDEIKAQHQKASESNDEKKKQRMVVKIVKKLPVTEKPKFKSCAKTILKFNTMKQKDHGLYLMIPVKFKFFSGKLKDESIDDVVRVFNSNNFIWKNINSKDNFPVKMKYGIDYQALINTWTRKKLKTTLRKCYFNKNETNVFYIKYNHTWWFTIDIGDIIEKSIKYRLSKGELSYKYHIDNLYNIGGSIAVLANKHVLKCTSIRDSIDFKSEEDKIYLYWNDKDSYGTICELYHLLLKKANNKKKDIDLNSFYTSALLAAEFTEIVIKTSPKKEN